MSIIESAFLKNQKYDSQEQSNNRERSRKRKQNKNGSQTVTNQLSIREDIAAMSQVREFTKEEYSERGLISRYLDDTNLMNEYRNMRTKLLAVGTKENFVTMITSVSPEFDASLVTANIASTFALDEGKTSVVINANGASEKSNDIFDTKTGLGLVDTLVSDVLPVEDIIYETPVKRLRYIPIGNNPESSAEHFSDIRMKKTMESILERYDERFIFINAPSIASSADTRILLDVCERVILVVPYGMCTEDNIRQAVLAIGSEKLVGVILEEF